LCVEYTKQYEVYRKVFPIHAIKTYKGSRDKTPLALNLGTEGGEAPAAVSPGKNRGTY